ncbi:MAG TPA: 6-phosphogluconolactonase [Anaerolineales bacterium]|nr:6-phosphogluconolactonase [Anaerolineales bacterium]
MKPELRIFRSMDDISRSAAAIFSEQAEKAVRDRSRFLVALNGGSTPAGLFQLMAAEYRERVDWDNVHVFWGDERCVPIADPGSSYGQAWDSFLRHVPIPESNVHRIKGELLPVEASKDYTHTLSRFASPPLGWPRFDLVYLGMGEDGHTASLFPGSPIDITAPVVPVTAHYQDRPAQRVTLTPPVFNSARTIMFMAAGEKKALTLAEVLGGRYHPELYPAQRIDPRDGKVIWLVDEEAASRLPMELVRKFCEG